MTDRSRRLMMVMTGVMTAALFIVMFVTHRTVPFMMDDLWYATMLSDDTPIASLADIVESQIWHYHNWGGRSMTHAILQLTLLAGELAADLFNVVFTALLGCMVCLVADQRRFPAFFAAAAMILGLNANWRMSMFWQAGAANYLYITVFILVFLRCYLRELPDEGGWRSRGGKEDAQEPAGREAGRKRSASGKSLDSEQAGGISVKAAEPYKGILHAGTERAAGKTAAGPWEPDRRRPSGETGLPCGKTLPGITLWILPLGILTGWSNENMGPAAWVLSAAVIFLAGKEGRRIKPWMILGNLACLFGSIMCIAAPGNSVRRLQIQEEQYGIVWKLFLRCYAECKGALEFLFPTLLVLGFLLVVSKCVLKQKTGRRNGLLLFCALLSWGAFLLSPHYPDRASFGTMVLCICVSVSLAGRILKERSDLAWPLWYGAAFICLRGMYFCGEYLAVAWGWI